MRLIILLITCATLMGFEVDSYQPKEKYQLFVEGWKFSENDNSSSYQKGFNDSNWTDVVLPHDMGISKAFDKDLASCQAYLPGGVCWYRNSFHLPRYDRNKNYKLLFKGAYCNSKVWCNGKLLGERPNGFVSFCYDITDYLEFGRENENLIAVRLDHSKFADSRWYTGTGINRDVYLVVTDKIHAKQWGTFVTTPDITDKYVTVKGQVVIENNYKTEQDVTIEHSILDKRDKTLIKRSKSMKFAPGEQVLDFSFELRFPNFWSIKNPEMYIFKTNIYKGNEVVDTSITPFGIRKIRFDCDTGFYLNDEPMLIKGVCLHDDAGALGTAVPKKVWKRRLQALKAAGCNAIRMSHNPHDSDLYDLCDEMGFLVMDEAFDEWHKGKRKWVDGWNATKFTTDGYNEYYEKWSEQDLTDMLLCNRNHPSIILWSIGNEIDYPNDPFPAHEISLVTEAIRLRDIVKKYDISRPVTAACAGPEVNIFKDYLDVIGYNYKEGLYEQEHSRYPYKIFTGSENGKKLSAWLAVRDNPFISSQFLWTGIDYLGEAPRWYDEKKKQYGRGSRSGLLDLAGFPKPSYYQRMAWWSDKPFVYLHKVNDDKITCYSNCTTVELYEDDKSLGVFEIPETKEISIENPRGKVYKAVGFIARVNVSEYMMGMPEEPAKLIATADTRKMILDGRDIAHVELFVVDKNGVPVGDAEVLVGVSIEGPAKILGIENGNQGDMLPYSKTNKTTYNGRLLVYVQSENKPGDITLNFIAEGFEPVSIVIDSQMPMDTKIW